MHLKFKAEAILLRLLPVPLLLVAIALLAGCGAGRVPDITPLELDCISLQPKDWYILHSRQMPSHPSPTSDGAWSVAVPTAPGVLRYIQTPYRATVPHEKISITFRVDSSSDATYNGALSHIAANPATVHIFLERRGDDLTKDNYRWWSQESGYVLGSADNSLVHIEVPLTSDKWTNVFGRHGEAEFKRALDDLGWVGVTFGGRNVWAEGVNMNSGTAQFTLLDFRIE